MVPEDDARTDVGTSADDAAPPEPRVLADLGQVPYLRAVPEFCSLVYVSGGLHLDAEHGRRSGYCPVACFLPGLGRQGGALRQGRAAQLEVYHPK